MDIDFLITLVFSKPPIWEKRDKKHSNRHVVDECWREISAEMNGDENKLRKKWKYLRDQFATEYGKIPYAGFAGEASTTYEPKWPYFRSLMFLKDSVKARNSSGNSSKSLKRISSSTSSPQNRNSYDTEKKAITSEDDEHLLFLKSLLPHIRRIPQEQVLSFRNEVQRTVEVYAYQTHPRRPPSAVSGCSSEMYAVKSACQSPESLRQ